MKVREKHRDFQSLDETAFAFARFPVKFFVFSRGFSVNNVLSFFAKSVPPPPGHTPGPK
jgi:hypothetical protein